MALPRIERAEREGRTVWIKRYSGAGRPWRMAVLAWLARRLGAEALVPPRPQDADAACATERRMIGHLAALGVCVPEIVASGPRELVLSDLGRILSGQCRKAGTAQERATLIGHGFAALSDLHRRGGYASQAFARNLTLRDGRVGFIDLEEDPATVMPLAAAQARDTLLYVHSTARFLADEPARYAALLGQHLAGEPAATREALERSVRGLAWLVRLARPFGARARGVALALEHLVAALRIA